VFPATGRVFAFGSNNLGQLGDGTFIERKAPVAVNTSGVLNGLTIIAIAAGNQHSLVLSCENHNPNFHLFIFEIGNQKIDLINPPHTQQLDKCFRLDTMNLVNSGMVPHSLAELQLLFPHQVFRMD